MAHLDQVLLPAQAQRAQIRADLDVIDAAFARLRAADSDVVGNAFRVEIAERLETQARVNRGLSYRVFGEIADPPDGPEDPHLAARQENPRPAVGPAAHHPRRNPPPVPHRRAHPGAPQPRRRDPATPAARTRRRRARRRPRR